MGRLVVRRRAEWLIFRRDFFQCVYCGRSPRREEGIRLNLDHVVALGAGGNNSVQNIATCCDKCNTMKGVTPLPTEVADDITRLIIQRNKRFQIAPDYKVFEDGYDDG